ncbi:MAG: T9SS type A sorting domain-containing protein, partial [Paludibacter sp.]
TVAPGAKLTLASGKTLTVVGALTLQSDASATATFVNNGGTVSAASTNVEQYLTTGRNWYISSPVSNGSTAVFNPAAGSNHLFWYDESKGSTNPWAYSTRNDSTLQVMRGYVANMASTGVVTFSGTLNSGSSITLNRTVGQVKEGFNLVGNPYPAHTTITKAISDAANALNTIWYRTASWNGTKYVYTFQTCLLNANGSSLGTPDTTTPIIAPMQAFWVRTSTNGSTLNFSSALQSHQSANPLKAPTARNLSQEILRLQVTNSDAIADETVLYFSPDASNSFDSYDAQKMFNNSASVAEIYTVAGNESLAINGLNAIQYDTEIALGFNTLTAGTFNIKASQIANFTAGTQVILKDYADVNSPVTTVLSDGGSYSFSSDATINNTSRFALIFRAPSVATGINNESNGNVWISTRNGQLVVNGTTSNKTMLEVFNAVGQKVISRNLTGSTIELNSNLVSGAYLLRITFDGKSITRKIIID